MRRLVLAAAMSLCATTWAEDFRLDAGVEARGGTLKVEPTVSGPPGKTVRYEIEVRREGAGNNANSSQSGRARLDDRGHAKLAATSVSLQPNERYEVEITLFEGKRVVARERISH